ncbi:P-loop NTPase fold protein [Methylocystis iwaonis]|uniref:KAP family P-loop NTPase fold protein n=1 Tax=Methylocystis iwaonis TaxID=2885079 RepID=UPI002E7B0748|nr:P-loop NTPase fold protein [Methylocystis iwaonis]
MSERLYADRPISHPQDDAFGLSSFADALATSLLQMSPKDGLVISVEGPWGAGKSSAIALATRTIKLRLLIGLGEERAALEKATEQQLDVKWAENAKTRTAHIVRFNPWNFSGQENLVRAFFNELAAQIDAEPEGKLKKAMNRLAGYLPSVTGGLAAAAMLAIGNLPAAAAAGATGRAAGETAERALSYESSLEDAKEKLAEALREADQRIIVIIDDLDRLLPSEMRAVFSLVKSLGDLPNVLYVLSFDETVVRKALEQSVERIDPAFLEKIVQVSLKLPPPWRDELRQLLFSRLDAIIGDVKPADVERWRRALISAIDPYLETPRDVTRLVNTIQVIWPNVAGDVDFTDLIVITTLQLFDSNVYALIRDEIEVITHADQRYEDDKEFGARLEPTSANKPQVAREAMALLFPRLAKAWNSFMADGAYYIAHKEQRRICTKEYHRNYFVFGRDARMLSRAEVEKIVLADDPSPALAATLKRLADDPERRPPRIATLLEQISEAVYAKPLFTPLLLRAILDHSDDLIRREDEVWELFVNDNHERLITIISLGVEKLEASNRQGILDVLLNYKAGLETRACAIERDARRHGFFGGKERHESERLFAADKIEAAALAVREEIAAVCEDQSVWQMPRPIRLIWAWRRMSDKVALSGWFERVLADDDLIVRLANELPRRVYRSGGRGTGVFWTFERGNWQELFEIDALFGRLEVLASSSPSATLALTRLREAEEAGDD